ncbi:hypothetical protein CERSUDRAFT_155594 [Gelatoporia subvermispora B]|uniref:F-box domain-containing protein n=1 Tax=Ceriporiopsis subvermispora (strain B) TaxID=914234 RepID=M2QJ81_CERS8|nr:hypothetical protein CERSUDRAFT_155594 [Gelatoporia subvermispora B]
MSLKGLPVELLLEIVTLALHNNPQPTDLLCVNKVFLQLGQRVLHTHIYFSNTPQLTCFGEQTTPLVCCPKTVSVSLAGGAATFDVFVHLGAVLRRCLAFWRNTDDDLVEAKLPLDLLSLCLHSHARNPNLPHIYEALSLADPKTFTWMGPDPDHHFSTAVSLLVCAFSGGDMLGNIVPAATHHLFRAIHTWRRIEHITLTNISFPADPLGLHAPFSHTTPLLPAIPQLRTVYLGQVTLLPPSVIAAMICLPDTHSLEHVRLVDAYRESIWGPRIRRSDVERAVRQIRGCADAEDDVTEALVEKVRRLVRCEAKTERIMGGDRVEGLDVLE